MAEYINKGEEVSKYDFFCLLKTIDKSLGWYFKYEKTGNDPMSSRYWVNKTATYEFYLVSSTGIHHMLVYKTHQRSHEEVEEQITKKYMHWFKQFKNGKTTTDVFLESINRRKK